MNATERKVLAVCCFVGSLLCFAPGQWVSGCILVAASGVFFFLFRRARRAELLAKRPAPAPRSPDVSDVSDDAAHDSSGQLARSDV